ncbi:hypothetical protein [Pedococcus bigeumensis]|uniref:hypothetical protein n=1 Tax=Pedococcus bigeumensis TaxID=433644 RepID=UPI001F4F1BA1|nr:hypothetical protein [Pedococcus bigeumensis]
MSVLYRAIWTDETSSANLDDLRHCAAAWAQETSEPAPLVEGQTELDISQGRRRRIDYHPLATGAFELTASDQKLSGATVWTTVIRAVADDKGVHTLVENQMESDDFTLRVSVGRPKVVHELLGLSRRPMLGTSSLLTEPQAIPAAGIDLLTDLLAAPGRTLPVIVCSEPGGDHDGSWLTWASRIASRSEGVAAVVTLDYDAVTAFKELLGDLAIWGGGIRVYAPISVSPYSDGWRHRYYLRARLQEGNQATIDRIVYSVAQLSARRRVPEVFAVFSERTGLPADALDGMIPTAEMEAAREEWEFDRDLAVAEHSELEKELARATGHLARLKDELLSRGLGEILWGTRHEVAAVIPDEVQDTSEAVLAARTYLSQWLSIPDSAPQELDDIDTAPNSFAWGNTTWRGLRALAAYAEDRANGWDKGGFWEWCAEGPLLGWPATTKKLAMSESETVQNSYKLRRTRVFKVGTTIDPSGVITMLAHLKISEGGGNLAPRVYFHDDTKGLTGKVHVGLVGPHYLVPNKSTN